MTEIDFSRVFPEQETEASSGDAVSGEKEREVTAPAGTEKNEVKKAQSATANAGFAAARRKAERERDLYAEDARKEATAAIEAETAEILTAAGFVNPYTGEPIRTLADLKNWQITFGEERAKAEADFVADASPEANLSPAEARAAEKESRAAAALAAAEEERVKLTAERELLKIRNLDDSVETIADVLTGAKGDDIYGMVKRGYAIADAYALAYREELQQRQEARLRQEIRNELRSKEHLTAVDGRGQEQPSVPPEIMREFRRLLPDATGEQICRFYQKDLKNVKRKKGN